MAGSPTSRQTRPSVLGWAREAVDPAALGPGRTCPELWPPRVLVIVFTSTHRCGAAPRDADPGRTKRPTTRQDETAMTHTTAPAAPGPFAVMLRGAFLPTLVVGPVAVLVAALAGGGRAALGACLGFLVTVAFFALGLLVMQRL